MNSKKNKCNQTLSVGKITCIFDGIQSSRITWSIVALIDKKKSNAKSSEKSISILVSDCIVQSRTMRDNDQIMMILRSIYHAFCTRYELYILLLYCIIVI